MPAPSVFELSMRAMTALITLLAGGTFALVPWIGRRREAFAVTVPETAQADPRIRRMRVAFTVVMGALSVSAAAAAALLLTAHPLALTAVILALPATGFALMLAFRARVRTIKRAEGWKASREAASAVTGAVAAEAPQPLSLAWDLLYLPVILATVAVTAALYPTMPECIPIHVNAAGEVDNFIDKGWMVFALPLAIQLFMAFSLAASHWTILRSKRPTSTESPTSSALAYGAYARAQSVALLAAGLLVEAAMTLMPVSFAGVLTIEQAGIALACVCVVACLVGVGTSAAYGQDGSRLLRHVTAARELSFDDDAHWRAGTFYVNREDPSVVVPRRFGVGWCMNWGNPKSWALSALLVAAVVAFVIVMQMLVG